MIEAIQQSDERAFEQFYKLYKDKLYFWLLGKTHSDYLSEEILQQTFVKIWINRHTLPLDITPGVLIFRTARSLMIDLLRKQAHERNRVNSLTVSDSDDSLLQQQRYAETAGEIEKVIARLPQTGQKVYKLSREEGLTYMEIARELSISPKTVEYHISKALGLLRKALLLWLIFIAP